MKKIPLFHNIIATSCGFGHFPIAPGTMGAIFGILVWLPIFLMCSYTTTLYTTIALIVLFTILGVWSAGVAEKYWGEDPSRVVMDETVGMWITLLPIPFQGHWWYIVAAFILFRLLDIFKPFGVRKMENLKGGYGIMGDDILAGIYGAIIIYAFNYFFQ